MPCTGTDDDEVDTTELVEQVLENRCGIRLRHVETSHDRFRRESCAKGLKSIEPARQDP